jgi:lipoprotein-releasing system permease protein
MLKLFLWLRYLRRRKIVFLSIAAVALSVSLLTVVASLFTGFIDAFERSAVETIGDVVLALGPYHRQAGVTLTKYGPLIEQLEQLGAVQAATVTLSAQGLLHLGKGNVRAVTIWGIEPQSRARVTALKQSLRRQKDLPGEPSFEVSGLAEGVGGFVGIAVVTEPNEKTDEYDDTIVKQILGQEVFVTTGTIIEPQDSSATKGSGRKDFRRRVLKFTVADIVTTGVYELDNRLVFLPIGKLQEVLYPDAVDAVADQVQIKLAEGARMDSALAQIWGVWRIFAEEELGWPLHLVNQVEITTARQMQGPYVAELRKQMRILLLIFGVVDCSVVVLIFCIFFMIVMTRQRDIAIIKSCGAASSSVALIFVGFGACVGIIGSMIGTAVAYVVTKNINTLEQWIRIVFGLKLWKSSVYLFSKIPNQVDWSWTLCIVILAVAAAAIGAFIPAIVAARTKPVEILRYE